MKEEEEHPECFGKKDSYLLKCWEPHHSDKCDLVEKCYQKYCKKEVESGTEG